MTTLIADKSPKVIFRLVTLARAMDINQQLIRIVMNGVDVPDDLAAAFEASVQSDPLASPPSSPCPRSGTTFSEPPPGPRGAPGPTGPTGPTGPQQWTEPCTPDWPQGCGHIDPDVKAILEALFVCLEGQNIIDGSWRALFGS